MARAPEKTAANATAWKNFHEELIAFMDWRNLTPAGLARRMELTGVPIESSRIRQWRAENGRPQFVELPAIVEALAMNQDSRDDYDAWRARGKDPEEPGLAERRASGSADWTYLVVRMGMAPSTNRTEGVRLATKLATLESRLQAVSEELAVHALERGASHLVKAVGADAVWAIAIWPAVEGFSYESRDGKTIDARLHVADRVDFLRVDRAPATKSMVWNSFEDILKAARAIPVLGGDERWPTEAESSALASMWAMRRLGAPHGSEIDHAYSGLHSAAVTSLTVGSWANDVADHLSRLIGYGFTSTRDIATDLYGLTDPGAFGEPRASIHHDFLRGGAMLKRVWGHFSMSEEALPELLGRGPDTGTFTVYLREHDADLEQEASRLEQWNQDRRKDAFASSVEELPQTRAEILDLLHERRAAVDALRDTPSAHLLVFDLGAPDGESRRQFKFRQCFDIAAQTVDHWIETGRLSRDDLAPYWEKVDRLLLTRPRPGLQHARTVIDYFRNMEKGR